MAKEVQMAARAANSTGRSTPPHHHHHSGGAAAAEKPVPGYLRPSAGSCHHVCKYGGTHTFDDKEAKKPHHPKPRRQPPPPPAPAPAPAPERQSKVLVKVRSVFRRRVGDSSRAEKAAAGKAKGSGEGVEWKDIVAYDSTVVPPHGSSSPQPERISAPVTVSGDGKKKDVTKGKKSHDKIKVTGQVNGVLQTQDQKKMDKNAKIIDIKSAKPPKGKKKPKSLMVEKLSIADQDKPLHGYQVLSHSLLQSRASLLRDLEEEMVNEDTNFKETKPTYSLDEEECAAAAETSSRSIPAHRRAKSMSISSSRSVRFPFVRQASKNSATFKLRSRSTKAPILPLEEEKPARLRSRTRGDDPAGGTGRGIQLRIRSLRRRGVGGSGGAGTGFVVPAVALRHQKTLEKKRSQRLYNNMIEETAGKLVKARKSRVKALVGAFESVISKIAK